MNTTDILDKTLAWLNYTEQEESISSRILSYFLQPEGGRTQLQLAFPDWTGNKYYHLFDQEQESYTLRITGDTSDTAKVTPQEVEDLTQIILHTLNSDPERYHDMAEIPGLEAKEYLQRLEITRYLSRQGLIEANAIDTKLSVKLTIRGTMYLRTHESAA